VIAKNACGARRDVVLDVFVHVRPMEFEPDFVKSIIKAEMAAKRIGVKADEYLLLKIQGYDDQS
jgi:hypothetical protein